MNTLNILPSELSLQQTWNIYSCAEDHGRIQSVAWLCHYYCYNNWFSFQHLYFCFSITIQTGKEYLGYILSYSMWLELMITLMITKYWNINHQRRGQQQLTLSDAVNFCFKHCGRSPRGVRGVKRSKISCQIRFWQFKH